MIAGIAPSVELTGGPWFTDNELDTELVDQLKMIALKFLQTKVRFLPPLSYPSSPFLDLTFFTTPCPFCAIPTFSQSIPSSVKVPDPSNPGGTTKFRPIFPVSATPFLPTVQDVLDYIVSLEVAVVELLPEHVEALLDLMVYDGVVEKVFVRRNEDEIDTLAAEANGKTKGKGSSSKSKGKGKASNGKGKRKTRGGSSDEDSDDSDDDSPKKKGKGKKGSAKRGANGKAKKKRAKLYNDDEEEESSESEDFNSDEEAPNKKKKKAVGKNGGKGGSDDEDGDAASSDEGDDSDGGRKTKGSSKRRKKRDRTKKKVKRSSSDDESSSSDVDVKKNGNGHTVDSDDEGGPKVDPGASQYVYRVIKPYEPVIGWTDMPCGRCPVEEFCSEPSRARAVAYKRPATVTEDSSGGGGGAPRMRIELEGGIQGVGMLGGAGASSFSLRLLSPSLPLPPFLPLLLPLLPSSSIHSPPLPSFPAPLLLPNALNSSPPPSLLTLIAVLPPSSPHLHLDPFSPFTSLSLLLTLPLHTQVPPSESPSPSGAR